MKRKKSDFNSRVAGAADKNSYLQPKSVAKNLLTEFEKDETLEPDSIIFRDETGGPTKNQSAAKKASKVKP